MKALLGILVLGMVLLWQPVVAAPWDFRPGFQGQDRRMPPPRPGPGPREAGREQRGMPERDQRPPHRLTDEERRELRRDLDRANREIYRRKDQR